MLGLPTETDEDVVGIADLAAQVLHVWRESLAQQAARPSASPCPRAASCPSRTAPSSGRPRSPAMSEYRRRVNLLQGQHNRQERDQYNWHDPDTSFVEAALSRGDRRVGGAIEAVVAPRRDAWRPGATTSSYRRWLDAFADCGLDPAFYATRERAEDEVPALEPRGHGRQDQPPAARKRRRAYDGAARARTAARPARPAARRTLLPKGGEVRWISSGFSFEKTGKAAYISAPGPACAWCSASSCARRRRCAIQRGLQPARAHLHLPAALRRHRERLRADGLPRKERC